MPKAKKSSKLSSKMKKTKIISKKKSIKISSKVAKKMNKINKIEIKKENIADGNNKSEKYDVEGVIVIEDKKKKSDDFLGEDKADFDIDDDEDLDFEADFDDGGD